MQRRQTIAFSIVATSFAPQGFTKAATPPSISFGDVEDAQAFGLNEWIRGLRLDADHASPSIARPTTKLGRTRQPDPWVHLRLRGRPARRESTPDAIEDHGCRCSEPPGCWAAYLTGLRCCASQGAGPMTSRRQAVPLTRRKLLCQRTTFVASRP